MQYINGLAKGEFLQHMFEEFPGVFNNSFAREMLENIVDYGTADNFTHTKNELYYFLMDMIPEVEPKDLIPFMDKEMLTDEVLYLVEREQVALIQAQTVEEQAALLTLFDFKPWTLGWNLYFDDEIVWTLDDGYGSLSEHLGDVDMDALKEYVDTCIEEVKLAVTENGVFEFDDEDYDIIREKMVEAFREHYGIEEKNVDDLIADAAAECEMLNNGSRDKADIEFEKE